MTLVRNGNFSSSKIWMLTKEGKVKGTFGAPALTYIEETKMEIRLGRSLTSDTNAKPTLWGTFLEALAFEKMPLEFSLVSKQRYAHKELSNWVGMPDVLTDSMVGDIKCPYTLKSFCKLADAINSDNPIEGLKNEFPEYYWQLVSNSILCDRDIAGLFVYVPYKSELEYIREQANDHPDSNKYAFINWAQDDELPYLIEGNHYKNFNSCVFEIPQSDKDYLTERVKQAIKLLKE